MIMQCPLTRREKIRVIFSAIEAIQFIIRGNDGGELLEELKQEWIILSRNKLDVSEKMMLSGHDYNTRLYVIEEKRAMIMRLLDELIINFPLSLIRNIVYTNELCTYDLIKRTLYTHVDMSKGQSRPKALAAYKESLASDFSVFGYSKVQSEIMTKYISEMIFGDTKGVNYPREPKTYRSKFITDHIIP